MSHNELSVYTAGNVEEANVVVAWLADRGVEAIVPERGNPALGLPNIIPGHVEVCVAHANQLDEARKLIVEHEEHLREHLRASGAVTLVDLTCPKCDKTISVEPGDAGQVIECPHCHEYVDVPDLSDSGE